MTSIAMVVSCHQVQQKQRQKGGDSWLFNHYNVATRIATNVKCMYVAKIVSMTDQWYFNMMYLAIYKYLHEIFYHCHGIAN